MKKAIYALVMFTTFLFIMPVIAQEQTLLSSDVSHGGFGGPVWKITSVYGDPALLIGGRGGWIINHVVSIGAGGYGLTNEIPAPVADRYLNFGYGGGIVEVILASDRLVHATANVLVGAGGINYRKRWEDMDGYYRNCRYDDDELECEDADFISNDAFFVIEPGIDIEFNVAKFMRVGAGISYRYIGGIEQDDLKDSDLSGVSASIILKFGKF